MRKKIFNNIMFYISIIYLFLALIFLILGISREGASALIGSDGLNILGCVFAGGEIFLSKRNSISKRINEIFIRNKLIKYRIGMSFKDVNNCGLEDILNLFDTSIKKTLRINELSKKTIAQYNEENYKFIYTQIPLEIEIYKDLHCQDIILFRISGIGKYGQTHVRTPKVLYVATLIKCLSSDFALLIAQKYNLELFELDFSMNGSELKQKNVFNDELQDVERYDLGITKGLRENSEIVINNGQILFRTTEFETLLDNFHDLTNIICCIE